MHEVSHKDSMNLIINANQGLKPCDVPRDAWREEIVINFKTDENI